MKLKTNIKLFALLIMAVGGVSSAWGDTKTFTLTSGGPGGALTFDENAPEISHAGGSKVYVPNNADALGGKFAFCKTYNTHNWNYNSKGLYWIYRDINRPFSVLNLSSGDVVVMNHSNTVTISLSSSNATRVETSTEVTTFTMTAAGNLDLLFSHTSNQTAITSISITSSTDVLTAPMAKATAANGGQRTITITPATSTDGTATITTYYNIGGTNPATTSDTPYASPFTIDENSIVNVLSVSSADGTASSSTYIAAGTTLQLAAPVATVTEMVANGSVYNPTYTFESDNSGLVGSPAATFKVNSETVTSYTPTSSASFTVTAEADGYASNSTEISLCEFIKTQVAFSDIKEEDVTSLGIEKDNTYGYNINEKTLTFGQLTLAGGYNFYVLSPKNSNGIFGRNASSKCTITVNDLLSNQYAVLANSSDINSTLIFGGKTNKLSAVNSGYQYLNYYTPSDYTLSISSVDALGYTFSSTLPLDFTGTTVEAYTAEYNSSSKTVTLNRVYKVPANTGLFIKGTADDIPVLTGEADAMGTNNLVAVSAATTVEETDGDYTNYVLGLENGKPTFLKANATTVPAGKAYLQIPTADAPSEARARLAVTFADDAMGITDVKAQKAEAGVYYNLSGQRVASPSKGLYIVNGKKIIIK